MDRISGSVTLKSFEVDDIVDTIREAIYVLTEDNGADDDDPLMISLHEALITLGVFDDNDEG